MDRIGKNGDRTGQEAAEKFEGGKDKSEEESKKDATGRVDGANSVGVGMRMEMRMGMGMGRDGMRGVAEMFL